jgi:two-component system LytT family response regulator
MSEVLRALIVDDERLARRELRAMLGEHPRIAVAGEAEGVDEAAALIEAERPDVVFLDVQMPGQSGFDLIERMPRMPSVVFVTAYDAYAIRAFEVNALDYLLKPVHPDRLCAAVERLLAGRRAERRESERLRPDDRVFLDLGERSCFLEVSAIVCIEAAADHTEVLVADGRRLLVPRSLRAWETRLPERRFVRAHRAAIVNLDHVERVEPWFHHAYRLFLRRMREPVIVSRRCVARLRSELA